MEHTQSLAGLHQFALLMAFMSLHTENLTEQWKVNEEMEKVRIACQCKLEKERVI
jgi:hypothetical protein